MMNSNFTLYFYQSKFDKNFLPFPFFDILQKAQQNRSSY